MRRLTLVTLALALGVSHAAFAQELPSPNKLGAPATKNVAPPTVPSSVPVPQATVPPASPFTPTAAVPYEGEDRWGAIPALPMTVMQSGDVRYINGGISDEELSQLKSTGDQYNLQLTLVGTGGEYLGDVGVRLTDASGAVVLSVAEVGPYLYVALKPGTYTLEAGYIGNIQKLTVKVPASGAYRHTFRFPSVG